MRMKRRLVFPFYLQDGRKISSPDELKKILEENPSYLIAPLKDGRLERFLSGMGDRFINCLQAETPEKALENLAKEFGIEDFHFDKFERDFECDVVYNPDEFLKLLKRKVEEIYLPAGEICVKELILDAPVKIVGQGKNTTILKCEVLKILSGDVVFENLSCETEEFLPEYFPVFKNSYFSFKTSVSNDLSFARGIETFKDEDFLKFKPKILEIEVREPIVLYDRKVIYKNVKFIFKEKVDFKMLRCKCSFLNCSFEATKQNITMFAENSQLLIKNSNFKSVSLGLKLGSKLKVKDTKFEKKQGLWNNVF